VEPAAITHVTIHAPGHAGLLVSHVKLVACHAAVLAPLVITYAELELRRRAKLEAARAEEKERGRECRQHPRPLERIDPRSNGDPTSWDKRPSRRL
jgi:hypothetical protein